MQNSQNDSGLRLLLFLSHTVSSRSQRHGPVRVLPGEEACLWRSVAGGRGRVCRVCTNRTVLLFTSVFARTDTCSCTHVCPCAHRTDSHTHDFINRFPSVPTGADTRAHIRAGTQRARVWTAADAVCKRSALSVRMHEARVMARAVDAGWSVCREARPHRCGRPDVSRTRFLLRVPAVAVGCGRALAPGASSVLPSLGFQRRGVTRR